MPLSTKKCPRKIERWNENPDLPVKCQYFLTTVKYMHITTVQQMISCVNFGV